MDISAIWYRSPGSFNHLIWTEKVLWKQMKINKELSPDQIISAGLKIKHSVNINNRLGNNIINQINRFDK